MSVKCQDCWRPATVRMYVPNAFGRDGYLYVCEDHARINEDCLAHRVAWEDPPPKPSEQTVPSSERLSREHRMFGPRGGKLR